MGWRAGGTGSGLRRPCAPLEAPAAELVSPYDEVISSLSPTGKRVFRPGPGQRGATGDADRRSAHVRPAGRSLATAGRHRQAPGRGAAATPAVCRRGGRTGPAGRGTGRLRRPGGGVPRGHSSLAATRPPPLLDRVAHDRASYGVHRHAHGPARSRRSPGPRCRPGAATRWCACCGRTRGDPGETRREVGPRVPLRPLAVRGRAARLDHPQRGQPQRVGDHLDQRLVLAARGEASSVSAG